MTLVDTSVWIDHLRKGNAELQRLLHEEQVLVHAYVIGELACGSLRHRSVVLQLLQALPEAPAAQHDEVLALFEARGLWGLGIGWIDAHLLASAQLARARLWSLDKPLLRVAEKLGVAK